jgi:hypothetical protein
MNDARLPDPGLHDEFALAEFVQLHEHMRQRDASMVQLVTVVLVSATAILSGGGAYVFQALADGKPASTLSAYVFLTPLAILIPSLAILRSHRTSIHEMGSYMKVFLETPPTGAQWQHALHYFRQSHESQSFDSVPQIVWTLAFLCFGLFWMTLVTAHASVGHWLIPFPISVIVLVHHRRFIRAKNSGEQENSWRRAREALKGIEE